jgi:hypothetical protein
LFFFQKFCIERWNNDKVVDFSIKN